MSLINGFAMEEGGGTPKTVVLLEEEGAPSEGAFEMAIECIGGKQMYVHYRHLFPIEAMRSQ